jgi:hypothetical protein
MKIKIIKIKVTIENQEFDFNDFFEGSNTIYTTNATLIKEKDGYYWHAFITYEPKQYNYEKTIPKAITKIPVIEKEELPFGFEEEIREYIKNNPSKKTITKNCILINLEQI